MQAPDSSQEDEAMKVDSADATEQEKSASTSTEGQKTDDDKVITVCWLL